MKEIDPILIVVLDEHSLGIATDQVGGGSFQLVGQKKGRLLVPEIGDDQLSEWAIVVVQSDPLVQDARGLIRAGRALQFDPSPGRCRRRGDFVEPLLGVPIAAEIKTTNLV